ncbi:MAG: hypothetical protein WC747_01525 [Candidatus Babeliales bacterium]|jgi:hypothetical protein
MKKYSIAFLICSVSFQLMSSQPQRPGTPPAQVQKSALTPAQLQKFYSPKTSQQDRSALITKQNETKN